MKYVTNHVEIGSAKGTIMVRNIGLRVEKNGSNGMYGVTKLRV